LIKRWNSFIITLERKCRNLNVECSNERRMMKNVLKTIFVQSTKTWNEFHSENVGRRQKGFSFSSTSSRVGQREWFHRDQFFVSRIIFTLLPISMRDQLSVSRIIFTLLPISMRDQFFNSIFTLLPISMRDQFFVSRIIFTLRLLYCRSLWEKSAAWTFLIFWELKNYLSWREGGV